MHTSHCIAVIANAFDQCRIYSFPSYSFVLFTPPPSSKTTTHDHQMHACNYYNSMCRHFISEIIFTIILAANFFFHKSSIIFIYPQISSFSHYFHLFCCFLLYFSDVFTFNVFCILYVCVGYFDVNRIWNQNWNHLRTINNIPSPFVINANEYNLHYGRFSQTLCNRTIYRWNKIRRGSKR